MGLRTFPETLKSIFDSLCGRFDTYSVYNIERSIRHFENSKKSLTIRFYTEESLSFDGKGFAQPRISLLGDRATYENIMKSLYDNAATKKEKARIIKNRCLNSGHTKEFYG
jgi:hypothetical protein